MLGEEDCCLVWAKAVVAARQKKRTRRNLMACSGMVNDHDYTSAHWSGAASVITAENTERSRLNWFRPCLRGEQLVSYTPAAGRSHIFPPQQPLPPLAMSHLPSLQQPPSLPQHDILPSLPSFFAIIGHFIPDLPSLDIISSWDIMASLTSLDIWPHLPSALS